MSDTEEGNTYLKSSNRTGALKILIIGGAGWLIAFILRIPVLTIFQILSLLVLGMDLNLLLDPHALEIIAQYSMHPLVQLWGPLFAGIFEEFGRFLIFKKNKTIRENRKFFPFIFGFGWSLAEILVILMPTIVITQPGFILLIPAIVERLSATIIHISLSYLVFYAIFEKGKKKYSLYLGITFHFFVNIVAVFYVLGYINVILTEVLIFLIAVMIAIFVFFWVSHKERKLFKERN